LILPVVVEMPDHGADALASATAKGVDFVTSDSDIT
jgi:hypothetical protein